MYNHQSSGPKINGRRAWRPNSPELWAEFTKRCGPNSPARKCQGMSARRLKKILKYIASDDLVKLKHYVKKYDIDVSSVKLPDGAGLLHRACALGHDTIARYLLKKGADITSCDNLGNTALHMACMHAQSGNRHAYIDLVLPLMKKWPEGLDVANHSHVTPRQLLEMIKQQLLQEDEQTETENEADVSSDPEADWNERLAYEASDEFAEQSGSYQENCDAQEPETWDDWADRIHTEYHQKHRQPRPTKRPTTTADEHPSKQKRISDEEQRQFQKKLEEEHRKYLKHCAQHKKTKQFKQKLIYKQKCESLFKNMEETSDSFGWDDIPWPLNKDNSGDLTKVGEFLFCDLDKETDEYKKYLREQQVQWHPDKFLQKCGTRLKEMDKQRIMERVKEIAQILNKLSSDCVK